MSRQPPRAPICGEASRRLTLLGPELARLADAELVADLRCRAEGWTRPGLRRRGARLGTPLAMAGAGQEGRFATVASGGDAVVLAREEAAGEAPRLVGPSDRGCFQTLRAVERIEVTREPREATSGRTALARLER
jgi:hypothetical protein